MFLWTWIQEMLFRAFPPSLADTGDDFPHLMSRKEIGRQRKLAQQALERLKKQQQRAASEGQK